MEILRRVAFTLPITYQARCFRCGQVIALLTANSVQAQRLLLYEYQWVDRVIEGWVCYKCDPHSTLTLPSPKGEGITTKQLMEGSDETR